MLRIPRNIPMQIKKFSLATKFKFISGFLASVLLISGGSSVFAQITESTSSGRNSNKPAQAEKAEARIRQVTKDSGIRFNQGLLYLKDNRRTQAREEFDKSVEVFLISGINIQSSRNLRECYSQLIETVYRMEFPSNEKPVNINGLSAVCSWNIKQDLADEIAKLVKINPVKDAAESTDKSAESLIASAGTSGVQGQFDQIGFTEQKFEPSPLDELAKLELNEEETNVETPEAKQEFEYIKYVVENRSLGFSFQMHSLVQQFLNYYRGRGRRTMEVGLYRSGYFMSMARRIFREEGVPENVAWLGQVESAWKPTAHSWASAAGLWQFIPGTGARYGLRRTAYLDERQSFEQATRASARYLKFLANRYGGNWELAMAGYNCGEGNVDKAIRRAGSANFWAAYPYLPRETRNYVPNILATIIIANNPAKYGFSHVRPAPRLKYDRIRVPSSTSLGLIAQAADTSVQYLRYLNPELRTNMTPPEPYVVRVPAGKATNVVGLFRRVPSSQRDNTAKLQNSSSGETWTDLSRRTGVPVADLMAANPGMKSPTGKVFVPQKSNVDKIVYNRPTSQTSSNTTPIKIVKAKSGDTVSSVAERHGANAAEVAKFNGLHPSSKLNAGREIRIPTQ